MSTSDVTGLSLLDQGALAQAAELEIMARRIVEGSLSGVHRSPYQGTSVEFAEHRQYAPGDDIRHLDWKVLGRTDRYVVKRYQQETNFTCHLLLDASGSMSYESSHGSRIQYARKLAACLAYSVLKQQDAVALHAFNDKLQLRVPPTSNFGSIQQILQELIRVGPSGQTRLASSLHELAGKLKRRSIVVVISDFLDDEEAAIGGINHLAFNGHEVVVFHTLDPDEIHFNMPGPVRFEGIEDDLLITTNPADLRRAYLKELQTFLDRIRRGCGGTKSHYVLVDTSKPLSEMLGTYLSFRHAAGGN
jgi:uncharacterized protein (DUF58 family)